MFRRIIASFICLTLIASAYQPVAAQEFTINQLPVPGTMVGQSTPFIPLALKGIVIDPKKPLEFQFIVDTGDSHPETQRGEGSKDDQLKQESTRLIKYFLAALTIPEGDLWVNLSPYEKDRILPQALGQTELGRDLLAQDYILKQLTASLIYPEKDLGKEFWSRVYKKAQEQFGTTQIPVNTFNKVWILPQEAQVFENTVSFPKASAHGRESHDSGVGNPAKSAAYVTKATLKVMLDEDYTALIRHSERSEESVITSKAKQSNIIGSLIIRENLASKKILKNSQGSALGSNILREIILPEIEKEVNTGKNFAPLRQIYEALILAKWYKEAIQNGLLNAVYMNKNKTNGVNVNDPKIKEQIYNRYLQAYKKGVFNYIKEDPTVILSEAKDPNVTTIPRKYFSGGIMNFGKMSVNRNGTPAMISASRAMVAVGIKLSTPTTLAGDSNAMLSDEQLLAGWHLKSADAAKDKTSEGNVAPRRVGDFEIAYSTKEPLKVPAPQGRVRIERQSKDYVLTAIAVNNTAVHVDNFRLNDVPILVIPPMGSILPGHLLFLPDYDQNLTQIIESRHIGALLMRARQGETGMLKFFHNSFGAGGVLNNLHVHGLFFKELLAIEKAQKERIKVNNGVEISILKDYPAPTVFFGSADSKLAAQESGAFVAYLQNNNIPYNVMITKEGVYVTPRSSQSVKLAENEYINLGSIEIAGRLEVPNKAYFDSIDEGKVSGLLKEAGISSAKLDELINVYDSAMLASLQVGLILLRYKNMGSELSGKVKVYLAQQDSKVIVRFLQHKDYFVRYAARDILSYRGVLDQMKKDVELRVNRVWQDYSPSDMPELTRAFINRATETGAVNLTDTQDYRLKLFFEFLQEHGLEDIVVFGGGVRDAILGRTPNDIDLTVKINLTADEIKNAEAHGQVSRATYEQSQAILEKLAKALGVAKERLLPGSKNIVKFQGLGLHFSGPLKLDRKDKDIFVKNLIVDKESGVVAFSGTVPEILAMALDYRGRLYGYRDALENWLKGFAVLKGAKYGIATLRQTAILKLFRLRHEFGLSISKEDLALIYTVLVENRFKAPEDKINEEIGKILVTAINPRAAKAELEALGYVIPKGLQSTRIGQAPSLAMRSSVPSNAMTSEVMQWAHNNLPLTIGGVITLTAAVGMAGYWISRNTVIGNMARAKKGNFEAMIWLIKDGSKEAKEFVLANLNHGYWLYNGDGIRKAIGEVKDASLDEAVKRAEFDLEHVRTRLSSIVPEEQVSYLLPEALRINFLEGGFVVESEMVKDPEIGYRTDGGPHMYTGEYTQREEYRVLTANEREPHLKEIMAGYIESVDRSYPYKDNLSGQLVAGALELELQGKSWKVEWIETALPPDGSGNWEGAAWPISIPTVVNAAMAIEDDVKRFKAILDDRASHLLTSHEQNLIDVIRLVSQLTDQDLRIRLLRQLKQEVERHGKIINIEEDFANPGENLLRLINEALELPKLLNLIGKSEAELDARLPGRRDKKFNSTTFEPLPFEGISVIHTITPEESQRLKLAQVAGEFKQRLAQAGLGHMLAFVDSNNFHITTFGLINEPKSREAFADPRRNVEALAYQEVRKNVELQTAAFLKDGDGQGYAAPNLKAKVKIKGISLEYPSLVMEMADESGIEQLRVFREKLYAFLTRTVKGYALLVRDKVPESESHITLGYLMNPPTSREDIEKYFEVLRDINREFADGGKYAGIEFELTQGELIAFTDMNHFTPVNVNPAMPSKTPSLAMRSSVLDKAIASEVMKWVGENKELIIGGTITLSIAVLIARNWWLKNTVAGNIRRAEQFDLNAGAWLIKSREEKAKAFVMNNMAESWLSSNEVKDTLNQVADSEFDAIVFTLHINSKTSSYIQLLQRLSLDKILEAEKADLNKPNHLVAAARRIAYKNKQYFVKQGLENLEIIKQLAIDALLKDFNSNSVSPIEFKQERSDLLRILGAGEDKINIWAINYDYEEEKARLQEELDRVNAPWGQELGGGTYAMTSQKPSLAMRSSVEAARLPDAAMFQWISEKAHFIVLGVGVVLWSWWGLRKMQERNRKNEELANLREVEHQQKEEERQKQFNEYANLKRNLDALSRDELIRLLNLSDLFGDEDRPIQYATYNKVSDILHAMGDPAGKFEYIYKENKRKMTDYEVAVLMANDSYGAPLVEDMHKESSTGWEIQLGFYWSKVERERKDFAMIEIQKAGNGGIDLNQINLKADGKKVQMQFDPAQLNQLIQGGFEGFMPVIINVTPIQSPLPLLGVNPAKEPEVLAKT